MRIVIFCILSITLIFSLSQNQENKNISGIVSLNHSSNNTTHIHESIERDEGTGFRIGTNFFIDNSQKRGKRDYQSKRIQN
uniref:Attacin_C domain-containing protein n=1 Tax=Strongyloides stercoralis TaxID=6248 RepID=A0A0K0ELW0_STRER